MSLPANFPLRWESTGDQWWYVSPVDWAAANGHYDAVRELIRLDGNNLIKLTSLRRIRRLETVWDDEEQFNDSAKCRSEVARKIFIECLGKGKGGRDSSIRCGYGGWFLYTAASAGDLIFVQELLRRDPLLVFGEGEYGVTDILYAAARSKNSEVFRVVLDFAVSPRISPDGERAGDAIPAGYKLEITNRALHAAARGGNLALLKELLGDCSDNPLAYRDIRGATILHAAAGRGQVEVVRDLISSASDMIHSRDNHGNTPLHMAAHRGHVSAVEALIAASPSSIFARNNAGETFLHSAISGFQNPCFRPMSHQINLLKNLLNGKFFEIEEIINLQDKNGGTALHLAIAENIHSDLVELLMTVRCIDVNIRNADGLTPLDILRRRPSSPSSELLTRQLISAGGIFSSREYSTRKAVASHIRKQSMGSSPGTSFRISDVEIFLHSGMENPSPPPCRSSISPEIICYHSPQKTPKSDSGNPAAQRVKGLLLTWSKTSGKLKKLVDMKCTGDSDEVHVPLRQRFSKPGGVSSTAISNKRPLSVRSNQSSPKEKKKLASEAAAGGAKKSRSSSFSKLSFSSLSSLDNTTARGNQTETEIAKAKSIQQHGLRTRGLMKHYLCFGGSRRHVGAAGGESKTYDRYELAVLTAA